MKYNPNAREKLQIVLNSYRMLGLAATLKDMVAYLFEQAWSNQFDEKYGVSTSGYVEPENSGIEDEEARTFASRYVATDERVMNHVFDKALAGLNARDFSFVDLGCGKGRTLILAAQRPFKRVIGVELSPDHSKIARQNVERYLASKHPVACRDVRVDCANATEYAFPEGDLFVYMYSPFQVPVLRTVADNLVRLQAESGRRILVAYSCPSEEVVFEQHAGFVKRMEYQVISYDSSWNLWECRAPATAKAVVDLAV